MKLFAAVWCALLFSVHFVSADSQIPEPSDRVQINETVTNGFIHPGIGLTKAMLESARKQVLAKREPWYSGYQALATNPHSSKTASARNQSAANPGKPDSDAFDSRGMDNRLKQDASKAKRQALMYFFTADEVYRANAMNIIRVWAQMDASKYKNYSEAHIHASYPIQDLIMAAELMRYTSTTDPQYAWKEEDTTNFTNNFVVPAVHTFLDDNGWFMNQNGYPLAASMSGDIFTNNRESYARRVEWFTINKSAPNKGWSSSIQDLARRVDTNALTGKKADKPVIQLMEMGRDQAHAGDDVEIFTNTARQMKAQGSKVDPVSGTLSTQKNAVGPYEFLDDRILAAADQFCRFMLGYDTPWLPVAYDIGPGGEVRGIYPRIADNYRGRIRQMDYWDLYYYYTTRKGVNVAQKAPYYYEAFTKRIVSSDTEWLYIPAQVSGEAAKVAPAEQEPAVVELEQRSTQFNDKAVVVKEAGTTFVRITPTEPGTRIAILSADTDKKTIGLRIRTTGVAEAKMSGFARPWLLPNTRGEWRYVTYTMGGLERFKDIVYFSVTGSPNTRVEIDSLLRDANAKLKPPAFRTTSTDTPIVAYVGAPIRLDFSATNADNRSLVVSSLDNPRGSTLNGQTGEFSWKPMRPGDVTFVVNLSDGETLTAQKVQIVVERDRSAALRRIVSTHDKNLAYVASTQEEYRALLDEIQGLGQGTDDELFFAKLSQLQAAVDSLEPLTPLMADGSMDYRHLVASSNIGDSIGLLTDGNDDTFPVYFLAPDLNYIFDFGPGFRLSATAFAIEGRLNFENRTTDTAFFGSNDSKSWTQLTPPITQLPTELTKVDVDAKYSTAQFRYLKIEKRSRASAGLFEPSELRIYGQRYEVK